MTSAGLSASARRNGLRETPSRELSMNMDYVSIGRNPPEEVNAIIEVPIGGEPIKYEMDKKAGTLVVDRFLYTPMRYPGNYGFMPHTLSEDGDPCDILVANTRPIIPGAVVAVRPIGVLKMTDEGGSDEKIVAAKATRTRPPAVAGLFYPRDPVELQTEVAELLSEVAPPSNVIPKALVAPHAGYVYSGRVAGAAFAKLRANAQTITRVVLIGPAHCVHLSGVAAPTVKAFETPLGQLPVEHRNLQPNRRFRICHPDRRSARTRARSGS